MIFCMIDKNSSNKFSDVLYLKEQIKLSLNITRNHSCLEVIPSVPHSWVIGEAFHNGLVSSVMASIVQWKNGGLFSVNLGSIPGDASDNSPKPCIGSFSVLRQGIGFSEAGRCNRDYSEKQCLVPPPAEWRPIRFVRSKIIRSFAVEQGEYCFLHSFAVRIRGKPTKILKNYKRQYQ